MSSYELKSGEVYVYLIHLSEKLGSGQSAEERAEHGLPPREGKYTPHCQHYVGATECLATRMGEHRRGSGARLLAVAGQQGIDFSVVRVWVGGWGTEKEIKRRKEGPALCPVCNQAAYNKAASYRELTPEEIKLALIPF